MSEKKMKIEFAPGCFDDFDGTQEELDEVIAEINRLAENGELFEKSIPMDELDLDNLPDDAVEWIEDQHDQDDDSPKNTRH